MTKLIGVYFKRHSSYISVLRFYDDNSVVKISSSAKIDEVIIHKRMSYSASGTYEIYESDKIRFSLKSSNGTIDYFGRVLDNTTLDLHSKSNINGNESQNIYKLRELVVPKPIQPKASEYKRLENNWEHIKEFYQKTYPLKRIYIDNSDNILVLQDNKSADASSSIFIIAYLHLLEGSPFWLYNEINKFVEDLRNLAQKNSWKVSEYRMILNFPLGKLANYGINQIPKDIKYYLIDRGEELNLSQQDIIVQVKASNNRV